MPVSQQKPRLSSSYEDEEGNARTLAPKRFSQSRLRVICSRGNHQEAVRNLDFAAATGNITGNINESISETAFRKGNRIAGIFR